MNICFVKEAPTQSLFKILADFGVLKDIEPMSNFKIAQIRGESTKSGAVFRTFEAVKYSLLTFVGPAAARLTKMTEPA